MPEKIKIVKISIHIGLLSKSLMLLGGLILAIYFVFSLFGLAQSQERWESVWLLGRTWMNIIPIFGLIFLLLGIVFHLLYLKLSKPRGE